MAQVLKLKRTAVNGKIPTTSNIELGELAMNTFDGRIFLKKDSGTPIVTEILTTNTENFITGSLKLNGAVTASSLNVIGNTTIGGNLTLGGNITIGDQTTDSITVTADFSSSLIPDSGSTYDLGTVSKPWNNLHVVSASATYFIGDGSGLTNVTTQVSEEASVTSSFTNTNSVTVTHGFDTRNIHVSVYNNSNQLIIPESITLTTTNQVDIDFQNNLSGYVVVAKGGHILSGSQPIAETATVTSSFDSQTSVTVAHNFDSKNINVTVYDDTDSQIIPDNVSLLDNNSVKVDFVSSQSGFIVVAKGGHIVQGTSSNATKLDSQNASYYLDYNNFTNIPIGLVSGSDQLTGSYDTRYALSGSVGGGTSDFTQLTNVPSGLVSGSSQVEFNDVNNIPFSQSATEVTTTKSIVPTTSTIDLGTETNPFRDLYLSSASLYIDGQQVISSDTNTLTFTTDVGQSIKLLETGADDIILQTDTGNIELKGTVEILSGKKIVDSAATKVLFGDSLGITGSIDLTGTVDGVDISTLKSDFDTLEGKTLVSGSSQVEFNDVNNNPFSSSVSQITVTNNLIPDTNETYDLGSPTNRFKDLYLSGSTVFLGDTKISRTPQGDVEFRDSQTDSLRKIRVDELEIGFGASARKIKVDNGRIKFTDTNDIDKVDDSLSLPTGTISGSAQIDLTQTTNYESGIKTKLNTEEVLSGSVISGNKTFNNDLTVVGNLNVQGTTTTFDTTTFNVADNIIELNYGGSATTAGIYTKDPTAPNTVSGSLLWDSTNDYWIAGQSGSESKVLVKNGDGVVSGSSQVSFNGITDKPSLVSGSSQVSYSGLSNIPSGIVSGSSQISLSGFSTSDLSEGSNLYYTDVRVKTKLNTETVISGSSQVDYNSIQNKPTIPTNNNQLTNGAGYITSFDITTQTDPKYLRSDIDDVSTGNLTIKERLKINHSGTDGYATIQGPLNRDLRIDINANGDEDSFLVRDLRNGDTRFIVNAGGNVGIGENVIPSSKLEIHSDTADSTVFDIQGTQGQLFSVTDNLIGSLFSVSDISGVPILDVDSSGEVTIEDLLVLPPKPALPSSPPAGTIVSYDDGSTIKPYYYDGSSWTSLF